MALSMLIPAGALLASASAPDGARTIWSFDFEGSAALKLTVVLQAPAELQFNLTQRLGGGDHDRVSFFLGRHAETGATRGTHATVSSSVAEANVGIDALRFRGSADALVPEQDYLSSWKEFPFEPGEWTFILAGGASQPVVRTAFEAHLPPSIVPRVTHTSDVGYITNRDFDEGASTYSRVLGATVAVAVAEETLSLNHGLTGMAIYVDRSPLDHHEFTWSHGGTTQDLEHVRFRGEPPGDHTFRLEQVSVGPNGPGRALVLWADLDTSPVPKAP